MTMEFELALQSVQPHLAVPFWDYTIDSAMVAQKYGKDDVSAIFRDGILFQEDFFGATEAEEGLCPKCILPQKIPPPWIPVL